VAIFVCRHRRNGPKMDKNYRPNCIKRDTENQTIKCGKVKKVKLSLCFTN
jgi:hypothetical protein